MADATNVTVKVKVTNLAPWPVYFSRLLNHGDVRVAGTSSVMLERDEVEQQYYNRNPLFVGTDGRGAHAHLVINDKDLKAQFDIPEPQEVMSDEVLDALFALKTQKAFEAKVDALIQRDYERHRLIDYIKRKKINDFAKIRYIEDKTEVRVSD